MLSTQRLKKELLMNMDLTELLDALKWIALAQFRLLQKRKERFANFENAFEGFFRMIDFSAVEHPFVSGAGKLGIILITSDEGFMGGLNTRVINTALNYPGAGDAQLIIIGERGAGYLKDIAREFVKFPGVGAEGHYEAAARLKDYIMKESISGKFGRLVLVYPRPVTFTVQQIEVLKVLPCNELFEKREEFIQAPGSIIVESETSRIIEYLVETWIAQKLFEVFEDSKLSEFSARAVHLEESHQVLQRRDRSLRFQYFKSQHNLIDKGMRETFSSQLLRKEKD
jgi:F-type H+-transporting ATPase subunit gamma